MPDPFIEAAAARNEGYFSVQTIRDRATLRAAVAAWRAAGQRVGGNADKPV